MTSTPLLGVLFTPLTLLAGPVASVTVCFVLAMPASAAAAYAVLRRWKIWAPAAALGGLAFGFSPYMINEGSQHLNLVFLPLIPLIVATLVELCNRPRHPLRWGAALGGLVAAQYFISSEVLALTVLMSIVGLTIAGAYRAQTKPGELRTSRFDTPRCRCNRLARTTAIGGRFRRVREDGRTMLQDRVAIITGAGRGIGREHALLFASLGAKVVVNDLGGAVDGSGADISAAQSVVDEITAAGGQAVANTDSVSSFDGAKAMVEQAVSSFGDLHVVVNNAGILRDRMLVSMSEQEFDDVIAVHLKGTFNLTRHAADVWRDAAKAGTITDRAIVNTSSGAGLHGNIGQTNYSAAKAGIAAMTVVNAMELHRYGVRANCIAPVARTRLTMQTPGMGESMQQHLFDPENVSPLVAVLAAEGCPFNGQVFSVYGGSVGIYAGWSIADSVETDDRWTADSLATAMDKLPRTVEVNSQIAELGKHMGR